MSRTKAVTVLAVACVLAAQLALMMFTVRAAALTKWQKVVRAERFELVDSKGKLRGVAWTSGRGALLALHGGGGEAGVRLAAVKTGDLGLSLFDEDGKPRATLNVNTDGRPVLDLNGSPVVGLSDRNGQLRATLKVDRDGSPGLVLFHKDGKVIWQAP